MTSFDNWKKIEKITAGERQMLTDEEAKTFIDMFGKAELKKPLFLKDADNYYNVYTSDSTFKAVKSTGKRICLVKELLNEPYASDTTLFFEVVFELD